jgi:hypothetical protein
VPIINNPVYMVITSMNLRTLIVRASLLGSCAAASCETRSKSREITGAWTQLGAVMCSSCRLFCHAQGWQATISALLQLLFFEQR